MDFAKANHNKKKTSISWQPPGIKLAMSHQHQPSIFGSNKGKVKIEQYEYDEENILG